MKKWLVMVVCMLVFTAGVFAEGKPLSLDTSSVEDGSVNVSVTESFELVFSNNVVNMKVKDNNMTMIELLNSKGDSVSINIEMADDQVAPELKRNVIVKPEKALDQGEEYKLIIKGGFMSKTGSELGQDITIGFKTEGEAAGTNMLVIGVFGGVFIVILGYLLLKKKNA